MSNPLPWYRRFPSDALSGYMCLNLEERGAYTTLLDLMYDRGESLHDNERLLAGHLGVTTRKWRSVKHALIEKGKITITDGKISNPRFEKEREKDLERARKRAENGSKGGRARAENEKKTNDNNAPDQAGLKQDSSISQKLEARTIPVPDGTGRQAPQETAQSVESLVWDKGYRLLAKAGKGKEPAGRIVGGWLKKHSPDEVLHAILATERQEVADVLSYANAILKRKARSEPKAPPVALNEAGERVRVLGA